MGEGARVLVVDDDAGVRDALTWALEADGFVVEALADGLAAVEVLAGGGSPPPALVVLDLSLPGLGGLDVLHRVRTEEQRRGRPRLPIIVLSGRDGETDRIVGLDLGADDYLVKPFSTGELAARARSLLRRCGAQPAPTHRPRAEGVEVDRRSRQAWVDGELVELAAKEFDLLAHFLDHPQRACSRAELLAAVWASHAGWQTESTVTEHVYRLRAKVELDPRHPVRLRTVRSVGYRWEG